MTAGRPSHSDRLLNPAAAWRLFWDGLKGQAPAVIASLLQEASRFPLWHDTWGLKLDEMHRLVLGQPCNLLAWEWDSGDERGTKSVVCKREDRDGVAALLDHVTRWARTYHLTNHGGHIPDSCLEHALDEILLQRAKTEHLEVSSGLTDRLAVISARQQGHDRSKSGDLRVGDLYTPFLEVSVPGWWDSSESEGDFRRRARDEFSRGLGAYVRQAKKRHKTRGGDILRQLELHCRWLIHWQVRGWNAADIFRDAYPGRRPTHVLRRDRLRKKAGDIPEKPNYSSIHKALTRTADRLGIVLRKHPPGKRWDTT
jgi:hypothetical protein